MSGSRSRYLMTRFLEKVREQGLREGIRFSLARLAENPRDRLPLTRADSLALFASDPSVIREREQMGMRATSMLHDASQVEATYPLAREYDGRFLRYAYLPATGEARGLVVLFHGHDAFLHLGPMKAWESFDILAPWDTFGWRRRGSWFWGEHGDAFVEPMVRDLIARHREDRPWFCTGGSMGGFAALYHGVKYGCDGTYVLCPQVDLAAKIAEEKANGVEGPYSHLQGERPDDVPNLLALAEEAEQLPPLFLVQNQYDHVNPFAGHAFRLLDAYNRKKGWFGLRIYPAIGHGGDGAQDEAELFFGHILDKGLPKQAFFSE
jgi:hypothetical protein